MSYLPVLALLDRMMQESPRYGAGERVQTLREVKSEIMRLGIKEHEDRRLAVPDKYYHPDGF